MEQRCMHCQHVFEYTPQQGVRNQCPNCCKYLDFSTGQWVVTAMIFLAVFALFVGFCAKIYSLSEAENEDNAIGYARAWAQTQARGDSKAEVSSTYKDSITGRWIVHGVLTGENMMGGVSQHTFEIQMIYDKNSSDKWIVIDHYFGNAY